LTRSTPGAYRTGGGGVHEDGDLFDELDLGFLDLWYLLDANSALQSDVAAYRASSNDSRCFGIIFHSS